MDILSQPPSTPVCTPRKRKALTLEDRVGVIQMAEAGQSARGIAAMYDVGKTQVQVNYALQFVQNESRFRAIEKIHKILWLILSFGPRKSCLL